MPQYLFRRRERDLEDILVRVRKARHVFLFLDYDGTLTPIRRTPGRATPSRSLLHLLVRLGRLQGVVLTMVTGRSLDDMKTMVRFKGLQYAANHGFEIETRHKRWTHPAVRPAVHALSSIARCLSMHLRHVPGAVVQNKKSTLTVHYRNVKKSGAQTVQAVVEKCVHPFLRSVKITGGKEVVEVRPKVSWGKGHAVRWILHRLHAPRGSMVVYCGDDRTDEDAFRLLPKSVVTIHVGPERSSRARYYVRRVSEMQGFLRALYAARS